jgi:RNA polymerase sigma factor CnrH
MPDEDPDLFLVQALQSGDDHALNTLMERHRQRIFHFIYRHISHEADALELAQETFVRAYFNIQRFQPRSIFSTWLHQIALNLCRDHVRSKQWKNRQSTDSLTISNNGSGSPTDWDLADTATLPSDHLEQKERMAFFRQSLEQLPLELKGPLLLTAVDGYSHQEAGKMLGLSAKAIEVKIYRARKFLTKKLGLLPH